MEEESLVVASFHPELVGETGLHRFLMTKVV
jgi:glutamine amidotransferase PdxT